MGGRVLGFGAAGLVAVLLTAMAVSMVGDATARPARASESGPGPEPSAFVPFSPNVRVNSGDRGYAHQVEPTMVVNSEGRIFVGWKEALTHSGAGQRVGSTYSMDGGSTFAPNILMSLVAASRQSDPWLTITAADRVYFTRLEYGAGESGISVSNTRDGVTWGTTYYHDDLPNFADKETAAHDAAGTLYWVWNSDDLVANSYDLVFARSNDGGVRWTPKVFIPDTRNGALGGFVAVHSTGAVLATWWSWATDDVWFDRSLDGGVTWGRDVRVNDRPGSAESPLNSDPPVLPAMAVAADGTIYVVWNDYRNGRPGGSPNGDFDILFSRSKDGGVTWSPALRVNDDTTTARQWMPDLAVDPLGGVHVAWMDDRTGQHNVYYANSTDSGVTFGPNVRVTTAGTPASFTRPGDYLAIESDRQGTVYVVWTDGRGADLDIYFAKLERTITLTIDTVPPGLAVEVDGTPHTAPYAFPCTPGSRHAVNAPSPQPFGTTRYTFREWSDRGAQAHDVACDASRAYTASFARQYEIRLETVPAGLEVRVESQTFRAPYVFWCDEGNSPTIEAVEPISPPETAVRFLSWSDGGAQIHAIGCAPATYTASYSVEHMIFLATSPDGLQVEVDDAPFVAPAGVWCPNGSTPLLSAPSPQPAGPTRHLFSDWSDGGAQSHVVACVPGTTYTATFATEHEVTVATSPPNLPIAVDGIPARSPQTYWWAEGSSHQVDAPSLQEAGSTRYVFDRWSDGVAGPHTIVVDTPRTLVARFRIQYHLAVDSSYGSPACDIPDCWYDAGSTATFSVSPGVVAGPLATRYVFRAWTGDSTSPANSTRMSMERPKAVTASWDTEYLLVVRSEYGNPAGAGWYAEGRLAPVQVDAVAVANGRTFRFAGWMGDASGPSNAIGIAMEGPKTVTATWEEVPARGSPGLQALAVWPIALAVVLLLVLLAWRRRRKRDGRDVPPTPPPT